MNAASTTSKSNESPVSMPDREELEALRTSVEKVLANECDSRAVHTFIDGKSTLDETLWSQAAALGWIAAGLPENWGGLGLGPVGLNVLHWELGRCAAPGPYIATLSVGRWLAEIGTEEQQDQFLPLIGSGELTAAVPAVFDCHLSLEAGGSRLHGRTDILGAPDAGLVVVPVGSDETIDAWALLQPDGESAILQRRDFWDRTREICSLECKGAEIVGLLADPDNSIGRRLQRYVALALAADSLGGAEYISHQTVEYLKERIQFERPIASFQAIKHRAADMVVSIETQRYILEQAVECAVQDSADADMWAALAKAGATKTFAFVSGDCIQLHGGVGHTWEFDPHIYAKRARLNEALVSENTAVLDFAAQALADATAEGRVTTELGL